MADVWEDCGSVVVRIQDLFPDDGLSVF
jgi:hypothetical protein